MSSRGLLFAFSLVVLVGCGGEVATQTATEIEVAPPTTEQTMTTTTTSPPEVLRTPTDAEQITVVAGTADLPTWTVLRSEILVEVQPPADLIYEIPQFNGPYEAANITIAEWMANQTDWWVEGLAEFPPLDNGNSEVGGSYELYFDATLVSADLASFRWHYYEYVCCRPYPNHGNKALVIELNTGRIIPVDEILDLDRLEEIHAVWAAHADKEMLPPVAFETFDGEPGFTSVALTPTGVEFGTDRGGPFPGTTTVVPFDALGDLVDQQLVERARQGVNASADS